MTRIASLCAAQIISKWNDCYAPLVLCKTELWHDKHSLVHFHNPILDFRTLFKAARSSKNVLFFHV